MLQAGTIVLNLPEDWFDDGGDFIGGTIGEDRKGTDWI